MTRQCRQSSSLARPRRCLSPVKRSRLLLGLAGAACLLGASLTITSRAPGPRIQTTSAALPDLDLDLPHAVNPSGSAPQTEASFQNHALPFLEQNCVRCHGKSEPKGGVILSFAGEKAARAEAALWPKVAQVLDSGQMPPANRLRPEAAQLARFRAWLDSMLVATASTRAPLRRLNRAEFNNTVHDLLGATLRPADEFPADDSGEGFDNLAQVLSISPTHIETYLRAANALIDEARSKPELWRRLTTPPTKDFIPYALRGAPPKRNDARKGLRLDSDDEQVMQRAQEIDRAYYALQAFADRAYRRPITHQEMYRLMLIVDQALGQGEGVDSGLARAFKTILVSPHFLFRMEAAGTTRLEQQGLANFHLASRLAYFLWSTMPDEELFQLASLRALDDPAVLNAQVRRMLRDPRASALAENFAGQWLQVRALDECMRDPARFPEFDSELRRDMLEETSRFFGHVVQADLVCSTCSRGFFFVNERLARHYGFQASPVRVRAGELAGTTRRLLTQASILTVTSGPTQTSPVKRGRWILDNILGSAPGTPPPGADSLAKTADTKLTRRQRLELHRSRSDCASCHARMDPLGFGLERFGPTGAWRDRDDDGPVQDTGVLPDGTEFHGANELRNILAGRADDFVRCLVRKPAPLWADR